MKHIQSLIVTKTTIYETWRGKSGDIIERYRYDAFGGIFTGITSPYNRVGFTGQEYDDKTGLIDMNARMYNPTVGQFTTADTYFGDVTNPLTLNRYAYVLNNPVNMWDPTGHIPEWVGKEDHYDNEHYEDIHRFVAWDWTLTGQGREEGEARQVDKYKDANYFYLVYEQDVYKWWTYNVIETTYDYNPNDPDWQEWILMGKGGRVTDNSDHTFEEYSIEGFEVQITPEEMALISKGIIDSYGPPPGERRMLYSINQGFLNGENISQDVIIYGGNGQQTKYSIYEKEIKEVIGKPQIGQVTKNLIEDKSNFTLDPLYRSPDNVFNEITDLYDIGKYGYGYTKYGFTVKLSGEYAIIKGARSSFAINEGIAGTRYALKNADKYSDVFSFVDPVTSIKNSFNPKTIGGKLGYAGIAIGAGWDTYNNIRSGADGKKIGTDIAVDVGFGAGGIAASAGAGALIGSVVPGPGTVIGSVGGFIVGVGYTVGTEVWSPGGKSLKDRAKEGLYNLIK